MNKQQVTDEKECPVCGNSINAIQYTRNISTASRKVESYTCYKCKIYFDYDDNDDILSARKDILGYTIVYSKSQNTTCVLSRESHLLHKSDGMEKSLFLCNRSRLNNLAILF